MKRILSTSFTLLFLLYFWQLCVGLFSLPNYILPSPQQVCLAFYQQADLLLQHTLTTAMETVIGLLLSIVIGCMAAIAIVFVKPFNKALLPMLVISQAIPTFAIAPLLVLWFGFGMASKIIAILLMLFFPIASAFYDGLMKTQIEWLDLAQTMTSSKWRTFCYIRLPAALPSLASGLRIAAAAAPIGAIVGEWVGSSSGLGYLMINANARMQIDLMFAALFVIILLSLLLYFCITALLNKWLWWSARETR